MNSKDIELIKEMLQMQAKLDEAIMKEYGLEEIEEEKLNMAILDEIGELTHELKANWCWWKKAQPKVDDAIKINGFIRLDKSSASEIDKQIEQTYLSLQKNIKFVCTNKDLMNSMLDELDYIVYASKLYGGKHVMEELDNRYKNKLMS